MTFTFADGTQVKFFTNMKVVANGTPLPQMRTYWYDTGGLRGLPPQNTFNSAYNLFAAGTTAHMESRNYFDGNPAATPSRTNPGQSTSSLASTFLSANLSQPPIFKNLPSSNYGAPIVLPYLAPGQSSATGSFAYASYNSSTNDLDVPQTGTISVAHQPTVIGTHTFPYVVTVDEPFSVRSGGKANVVVGAYILDNGISGPVADGQGSVSDNLGEGRFFVFYTNPGPPQPSQADPTHLRFTWTPPDPSSQGSGTTVSYILTVDNVTAERLLKRPVQHVYRLSGTQQDVPAGAGDPFTVTPGDQYVATVAAQFLLPDGSRIASDPITGPPITAGAGGPVATSTATATASPAPTVTSTPLPTATPTAPPTPTDTPTPLPTATAMGVAALQPERALVYAWLHTQAGDDALLGGADTWSATTWGNVQPSTFYWPAGRPLRLVPAVLDHPDRTVLKLMGDHQRTAYVNPQVVRSLSYALPDGGCLAGGSCCPAPTAAPPGGPYTQNPSFPAEIDPTASQQSALVWSPSGVAPPDGAWACPLESIVQHGGVVTQTFTVTRESDYALRFLTPTPPVPPLPTYTPVPVVPLPTSCTAPVSPPAGVGTLTPIPVATTCTAPGLLPTNTSVPLPVPTITPPPDDATPLPTPTWPAWTPQPTPGLALTPVPGCSEATTPPAHACPTAAPAVGPAYPGWPAATPTAVLVSAVSKDSVMAGLAPLETAVAAQGGAVSPPQPPGPCRDQTSCQLHFSVTLPQSYHLVYRIIVKVEATSQAGP